MSGRSLASTFARARAEGRAALVAYLAAGDPAMEATVALAGAVAEGGADVLELGIPFSDPLADGPIIQAAYTRALAAGASVKGVMEALPRIVERSGLPVVLMTACNPLLAYGQERFCRDAAAAGASGVLVPDLLPEESGSLRRCAGDAGLDTIFLTAPDTEERRLAAAAEVSTGFLYLISRRGLTGPEGGPGDSLEADVARARRHTSLPIAVGFGVSTAGEARRVAAAADGVIVGSAFVRAAARRHDEPESTDAAVESVRRLAGELMAGIRQAGSPPTRSNREGDAR